MTLKEFNRQLVQWDSDDLPRFVQKYLFHGTPYVFKSNDDGYFDFRNRIATKYDVGFHQVFIIGSAKQGFSYIKKRASFDQNSDVDVVIVSNNLFNEFGESIREYQYKLDAGLIVHTEQDEAQYVQLLKYFAKGWIRPDKILPKMDNNLQNKWFSFFKSISHGKSEVGNYHVAGGIFKSYDCLERYHISGVTAHRQGLESRK